MITPNQEYGRRGQTIRGFVIHRPEGSFESAESWIMSPKSQVSYHDMIDTDGTITNFVMPKNTAWHAGLVKDGTADILKYGPNPNFYTIGISLAGFAKDEPTQAQITACAKLISTYAENFNIQLDNNTIIPHHDIRADKLCPGVNVSIQTILYLALLPQT